MTEPLAFIGIDAGGTKTELVAQIAGGTTITLAGEGANVQRIGADEAARRLAEIVALARGRLGDARLGGICAGVAGAGRRADRQRLLQALVPRLSATLADNDRSTPVRVVHDGVIALETAFPGSSGIIVIAGTGSIAYGRKTDGTVERVGGWGYLLGDEGSGYAIGLHGLRAVLASLEGGPATTLAERVRSAFDISDVADAIRKVYAERWTVQQVAPLVLDAATENDAAALHILQSQAGVLAEQVSWLAQRLEPEIDHRIGLLGGLAGAPPYQTILSEALKAALPGWEVFAVADRPVTGALRLARKLSETDEDTVIV